MKNKFLQFINILAVFFSVSTVFAQVNLNNGLVAYYPFNNNPLDASGNANHGTAFNNTTYITDKFGNPASAVSFGGTASQGRISINHAASLSFTTGATFAFWARVSSATGTFGNGSTGAGGSQCFFAKAGDAGGGFWQLSRLSGSQLTNQIGNNGMTTLTGIFEPYSINQWIHYVVTMDASGHKIFVNGVLQSSNTEVPNFAAMDTRPLVLGRFNSNWYPLNGGLDEFRVYNRVLTQAEIDALVNNDVPEISISLVTGLNYCAGDSLKVNFTGTANYLANNEFYLQMSDANGGFSNPITLAKISSNIASGQFKTIIPFGIPSGSAYKFRVISSSPLNLSNETAVVNVNGTVGDIPNPNNFRFVGEINGKSYFKSLSAQTYTNAKALCESNGGHLAIVYNADVQDILFRNIGNTSAWIGLSDTRNNGTFVWENNSPFNYTNWAASNPGADRYVVIRNDNGQWNTLAATQSREFYLELNPAGVLSNVCSGENINLNAATLQSATYNWTGVNNFSSSLQSNVITNASALNSGLYQVSYSKSGCNSLTYKVEVNVNPLPINLGQSATLPTTINTGLEVFYPMNGTSADASGNNRNATFQGGVTIVPDRFGNDNSAFRMNGTNGHLQAPAGIYFNDTAFTVSAWIRKFTNPNFNRLMDFGNGSANNNIVFALSNGTTGRPISQIFNGTTSAGIVASTSVLNSTTKWELLTYTWKNNNGKIYIDGVLIAQNVQTPPATIIRNFNYIGRSNWTNDGYANATFDDFRIHNRALSESEIIAMTLEQPNVLNALALPNAVCQNSESQILLINSQPGVSYQLKNATTNANIGTAQLGSGDTLIFNTGNLTATTEFNFSATVVATSCSITLSPNIVVNVNNLPNPPQTSGNEICNSGSVTVSASGAPTGGFYNWYNVATGGTAIVGNNSNTLTTDSLLVSQNFFVSVTDSNGCESANRTLVIAGINNPLNAPVDIISGVILHYKLDSNLLDASVNGLHATGFGNISYVNDKDENPSSALRVTNTNIPGNSYFSAGNPTQIQQLTNQVTISMWIKQSQTWFGSGDGFMPLANKWANTGMYIGLNMYNLLSNGTFQNRVRWRINGNVFLNSNTNVPVNRWHHIVCTYDGANLRIYQDGVLTGTRAQTGNIPGTGVAMMFGRQSNGSGDILYRGDWDEVKMYNRALNGDEVKTLFNNESVAFTNTPLCDELGNLQLSTFEFSGATYQWTGPNGFSSTQRNPPIINNADSATYSGTYTLTVTKNGCVAPPQTVEAVIYNIPNAPAVINDTVCGSGNAVLTAVGPPSGVTYNWYTVPTGGTRIANQSAATLTINNLTVTTSRYVSITRNDCEGDRTEVIAVYQSDISDNLTVLGDTICNSDTLAALTIINAENGVIYEAFLGNQSVSNTATGNGGNLVLNVFSNLLNVGDNNISVKATQLGCGALTLTNTANITKIGTTTVTISHTSPLSFCQGDSVVLTASASANYLWSNGSISQSITVYNSGTYSVSVLNANGCSAIASVVTQMETIPVPTISANGATNICAGDTVILSASGASSYVWSNNQTTSSIQVTQSGIYNFVASNGNCSVASSDIVVNVNTPPDAIITANGSLSFCNGDSVILSSNLASSYLWSNGSTSQSITVYQSGTFSVTTSNGTCSNTSSNVIVNVNAIPTASISANGSTTFCEGGNVVLTANTSNSYQWNTGSNNASITVTQSGTYTVAVGNGNCFSNPVSIDVLVNPLPNVTINASQTNICEGNSVVLSGQGASTYTWNNNINNNTSFFPTLSNTYTVTGIDTNNCSNTAQVLVEVSPLPDASFVANPQNFCPGITSIDLTANNTNYTSYTWSRNGSLFQANAPSTISITQTGNYQLQVIDINGCSNSSTTSISTQTTTPVTITAVNSSICPGSNQLISANLISGASYIWYLDGNPVSTIQLENNTYQANAAGTYYAEVVNSGGCISTSNSISITLQAAPTVSISVVNNTVCQGSSNTITATSIPGATYTWFRNGNIITGASGNTFSATLAGNYQVEVLDGCSSVSNTITLTVSPVPNNAGNISGSNSLCAGDVQNYSIFNVNNATSYLWTITPANAASIMQGQGTNQIVVNSNNQNFTLTVTPQNDCGNGGVSTRNVTVSTGSFCSNEVLFAGNTGNICQGGQVTYTNYTSPNFVIGLSPRWNFGAGANPATATGNGPHTVTYNTSGLKTVILEYVDNFNFVVVDEVKLNYINVSAGNVTTSSISGNINISCANNNEQYSVIATTGSTYNWTVPNGANIISGQGSNSINVNMNGNGGLITVIETNSGGCVGTDVNLAVFITDPVATSPISGNTMVECTSSNENYAVVNTLGSTYNWSVPNGAIIISGQGSSVISVNFNGNFGQIAVTETNAASCVGSSVNITVNCNVSDEIKMANNIKVYPNPTFNNFTIEIPEMVNDGELSLYDAYGKLIIFEKLNGINKIDLSPFANGVYYGKVLIEKQQYQFKMVKVN
jgi:hypothetical protein